MVDKHDIPSCFFPIQEKNIAIVNIPIIQQEFNCGPASKLPGRTRQDKAGDKYTASPNSMSVTGSVYQQSHVFYIFTTLKILGQHKSIAHTINRLKIAQAFQHPGYIGLYGDKAFFPLYALRKRPINNLASGSKGVGQLQHFCLVEDQCSVENKL